VNAAFNALLSDSVSAIVLQRQQRLLIGPTGTSVVIPWLTAQLLSALSEQSPQFVEAKRLQALVWPDTHISADALKQRVRLARQALREAGYDAGLLDSVRGEGYALRVPLREPPDAGASVGVLTANETPPRSGSTHPASWFRRFRIGIVAALTATTALVAVGIRPSLLPGRGGSHGAVIPTPTIPLIGSVPLRVMLVRDVHTDPSVDAALDALHTSTRRALSEHVNVLLVPLSNGSACGNSPPAHLCARISGSSRQVRLDVTERRSGGALVQGEWPTEDAPDTLLSNAQIAAQLAVLLSPGALRWIGEPRGRGDRDFATILNAATAAASCDVEVWREARRTLDDTVDRAPQFQVARALRALLTVAIAGVDVPAPGDTSTQGSAPVVSDALKESDALRTVATGQPLAHATRWLHGVRSLPSQSRGMPPDAAEYSRLRRLSPSAARLADHLRSCIASGGLATARF